VSLSVLKLMTANDEDERMNFDCVLESQSRNWSTGSVQFGHGSNWDPHPSSTPDFKLHHYLQLILLDQFMPDLLV
jgi:hypothetical protein